MKKLKLFLILSALTLVLVFETQATIINVPADYPNIQAGISAAVDGDTVLVQPGTYVENINFNGKNITVTSLFLTTGDTTFISATVIDKAQNGPVVTFTNNIDSTAVLCGFAITNSSAQYIGNMIACLQSGPTLCHLKISGSIYSPTVSGGGIWCMNYSSPNISNVTIFDNEAASGGGIYCYLYSNPKLRDVVIKGNYALFGGGIYCNNNSSPELVDVIITGNEAANFGGGIECYDHSNPVMINVLITGNIAETGGGIYAGNHFSPIMTNVTVTANEAENAGGVRFYSNFYPVIVNSIFWNNIPSEIDLFDEMFNSTITVSYSDIDGGEAGIITNNNFTGTINWEEGNIDADPLFVDPSNGDYHLTENSPCIDAGDPNSPLDPDGTIADMGVFYFDQSQPFIEISGPQSGVWPSGNLYHVIGDVTVPNDDTLIIEPGVTIKFMDYYSFIIFGTLIAAGTETDSIYFTSGQSSCNPGDWNRIRFEGSSNDNSIISYAYIKYASFGIYCNESSPIISNNIISNNSDGIYCSNNSSPTICNNTISNNSYDGICCGDFSSPTIISNNIISNISYGIYSFTSSSCTISNNTINNNGLGIWCYDSSPTIRNNIINDNNDIEIFCYYSSPTIISNNITGNNNGNGIDCYYSSPSISNNTISNNFTGIYCNNNSSPTISKNTISNNTYGIYCNYYSSPSISNNTINNNNNDGIYCKVFSYPFIVNNILFENNYGINAETAPASLEYNLFWENNTTAIGEGLPAAFGDIVTINTNGNPCDIYYNLFMDPLFMDPANFNFYLLENSPCIDAGDPSSPLDPDGTIADMGAFYFDQPQFTQQIILSSGYSFVSSHIIPDNPDMLIVIEEILNENLDFIRNSQGQTLRKIGPNWVNDIGDWIVDEGYLVKMNAADSFTVEGTLVDLTTPIPLETGFQFVSYFLETPVDALIAFATIIGDDLDFVRNSQGQTLRKIGPNWVNGIGDCQSGEGYLIKMFADEILIYPVFFACGNPFTDPRNGQTYNTVQIGDQCWMAENLNIGEMINGSEEMSDNSVIEKYCYDDDTTICLEYGGLYQWNEIMQYVTDTAIQGICPEGWYIPTDNDFTILTDFLGGESVAGGKLKETGFEHWNPPNTGATNESGFYAFAGGYRFENGFFDHLNERCYHWSSTESGEHNSWFRFLNYYYNSVYRGGYDKSGGYSVRCIKDNSKYKKLSLKNENRIYNLSEPENSETEPVYFVFSGGNPADPVFAIYVDGLEIGDEVAAYNGDYLVGAVRINSENAFENELPVFSTLTKGQGYEEGNPIILKAWSENNIVPIDFTMETMYDSYVSDVYPKGDGNYSVVNITKEMNETAEETISVYPNPSKGIFNFSIEGIEGDIQINVIDIRGKEYYNFEINVSASTQLDLTELATGVYFISFRGKDFRQVKKIVIK